MPEIAGLHAVLPRLLALDLRNTSNTSLPEGTVAEWKGLLARLPALPTKSESRRNETAGTPTVLMPGALLPSKSSNSENAELYVIDPTLTAPITLNPRSH